MCSRAPPSARAPKLSGCSSLIVYFYPDFDHPTRTGPQPESGPGLGNVVIMDIGYLTGLDVSKRVDVAILLPIHVYNCEPVAGVERCRPMRCQPVWTQA